jgi:peptide/nickel transport system ATP-binding protein
VSYGTFSDRRRRGAVPAASGSRLSSDQHRPDQNMTLLDVEELVVRYDTREGTLYSVNGVSFRIEDGVNYALSGESASGKTTIAKAILGRLPEHGRIESGRVEFRSQDRHALSPEERQDLLWEHIASFHRRPSTRWIQ